MADCNKILTDQAKSIIWKEIQEGRFNDRVNELEPPSMAPSTDPEKYSKVRDTTFFSQICTLTPRSGARFATTSGTLWFYVPDVG